MTRSGLGTAAVLAVAGCAHRAPTAPELPDGDVPAAVGADARLATEAVSLEPQRRAAALAAEIQRRPDPVPWIRRALYDPDPQVGAAALDATDLAVPGPAQQAALDWLGTGLGDPLLRGLVALEIGPPASAIASTTWSKAGEPWARLPLALAAARGGDEAAAHDALATVRRGELPWDAHLLAALAQARLPGLPEALAEAEATAEPEIAIDLATARVAQGDPGGEARIRDALTDPDPTMRLAAVDRIATLPDPDALLRRAIAAGPPSVSALAATHLVIAEEDVHAWIERLEARDEDVAVAAWQGISQFAMIRRRPNIARRVGELAGASLLDSRPAVRRAAAAACSWVPCPPVPVATVLAGDDAVAACRVAAATPWNP